MPPRKKGRAPTKFKYETQDVLEDSDSEPTGTQNPEGAANADGDDVDQRNENAPHSAQPAAGADTSPDKRQTRRQAPEAADASPGACSLHCYGCVCEAQTNERISGMWIACVYACAAAAAQPSRRYALNNFDLEAQAYRSPETCQPTRGPASQVQCAGGAVLAQQRGSRGAGVRRRSRRRAGRARRH